MADSAPSLRSFALRWTLCCSLLATIACSASRRASDPPDAALHARARLLRIEDTRRDEPAFVDSLLRGLDARERSLAALTAGRLGARRHLPSLRVLAADADTAVAASSLFALGLMKDTSAAMLAAASLRRAPSVGIEAAWLLGELGERGRLPIARGLADLSLDSGTRGALLLAAARLRPVPLEVLPWIASPDSALAWRAAYAVARGRLAAGVRNLLSSTDARAAVVREHVARGLSREVAGDSLGIPAQQRLRVLVTDREARVRVNAVRALATYGRTASEATIVALGDRDAGVRLAAAQSLDAVLDSSEAAWSAAIAADTAFVVQQTIAAAAARRGHALLATRPWRTSPEWSRRAAVVQLDARGRAEDALERVAVWRDDADARVRAAATRALGVLADSPSVAARARGALRDALRQSDVGVRSAALAALARGATDTDLAAAIDARDFLRSDTDNDARLAFWRLADSALSRPRGALADSTLRRLDAIPRPDDPLERIAASRLERFVAWRDSTGTARPMEWYLGRARESEGFAPTMAIIETERGVLELRLHVADAPRTVHNFVTLARRGYFDGQRWHRVVPNFVVQGGDPRGDGTGGPGYAISDEMNRRRYLRGTLGMALSGPHSGGSQFFVTHSPQPHLDGGYTVFGQLVAGEDVLDRIVQGDRIVRVIVR